MSRAALAALVVIASAASCDASGLTALEFALLSEMAKPERAPRDATNRFIDDEAVIALGHALYFDRRFSGPLTIGSEDDPRALGARGDVGRVGCVDCHALSSGAADARHELATSLGAALTGRASPSVFYTGENGAFFSWDGSRDSAWNQTLVPMESSAAQNTSRLYVVRVLVEHYQDAWARAYPTSDLALPALDDAVRWNEARDEEGALVCPPGTAGVSCFCPDPTTSIEACPPPSPSVRGRPGSWEWDRLHDDEKLRCNRIYAHFAKALDAYVRTLRPYASPFDRFLAGDVDALSPSARRGAALFVGKAACNECHRGPTLTDGSFRNIGVPLVVENTVRDDAGRADGLRKLLTPGIALFSACGPFSDESALFDDEGHETACGLRERTLIACSTDDDCPKDVLPCADADVVIPGVCGETRDTCFGAIESTGFSGACVSSSSLGAFKVPTLRNVGLTAPYMHNGALATLWDVVEFYNEAEGTDRFVGTRDRAVVPLGLDDGELNDLVAFMLALTDDLDTVDPALAARLAPPSAP